MAENGRTSGPRGADEWRPRRFVCQRCGRVARLTLFDPLPSGWRVVAAKTRTDTATMWHPRNPRFLCGACADLHFPVRSTTRKGQRTATNPTGGQR